MFFTFEKMEFPYRNSAKMPSVFLARPTPTGLSQGINYMPHISQSLYHRLLCGKQRYKRL